MLVPGLSPSLLVACSDQLKAVLSALIEVTCGQNEVVCDVLIVAAT